MRDKELRKVLRDMRIEARRLKKWSETSEGKKYWQAHANAILAKLRPKPSGDKCMSTNTEILYILNRARRQVKLLLQTLADTPQDDDILRDLRQMMNIKCLEEQLEWIDREMEKLERTKRG